MAVAARFHVKTVLKLKIIFKDLIKLPTLAGKKTKKKLLSKSNLLYKDTVSINIVLKN